MTGAYSPTTDIAMLRWISYQVARSMQIRAAPLGNSLSGKLLDHASHYWVAERGADNSGTARADERGYKETVKYNRRVRELSGTALALYDFIFSLLLKANGKQKSASRMKCDSRNSV